MSTMANTIKSRRPRRQFDDDFKTRAVRPVLDEGVRAVARDFDLTETALRQWVHRARADRTTPARAGRSRSQLQRAPTPWNT